MTNYRHLEACNPHQTPFNLTYIFFFADLSICWRDEAQRHWFIQFDMKCHGYPKKR